MRSWNKTLSRLRTVNGYAAKMAVASLIGLLGGFTAIAFHLVLEHVLHYVNNLPQGYWRVLLPAVGGLGCGLLVYPLAPEAAGQGVDSLIDTFHNRNGSSRLRVAPIKFLASIITIASGGSGGYEGPVSQIGGALSGGVSRLFSMPRNVRRTLLLAGTAAGLGAVFKAPLGGALTSVEMLYKEDFESEALVTSIVAAVVAFAVYTSYAGVLPAFGGVPSFQFLSMREMGAVLILGFLCAPFSRLFVAAYFKSKAFFDDLAIPSVLKPALGGLGVGVLWLAYPEIAGNSMQAVGDAMQAGLQGGAWLPILFLGLLLAKIVATALTVGSGGAGGLFGPSLFMGGVLGASVGWGIEWFIPSWLEHPGALVLVGMGAFFAGAAKAPIAGVVMVCEMTGNYSLLPALLVASIVHVVLTHGHSIYKSQVRNKFASPAHRHDMDPDVLRLASAGEFAKSFNGRGIDAGADLEELRRVIGDDESPVVPVFQKGRYQGVVDATSVLRAIARDGRYADHLLVSDFLVKVPLLHPGIDLHTASRIMLRHDVAQILVGNEGVPTALLEQHQIVRAYDDRVRSGATKG